MAKKPERSKPLETLEQVAARTYRDKELAARVVKEADAAGTREAIEDGRSTLPHPTDAAAHFARVDAEADQKKGGDE